MAMSAEHRSKFAAPYEWKILEWDKKKPKQTNIQTYK